MNIKKPLLIIISLLLLILLLFFICSDRGMLFKDDTSVSSVSDSGGIGYMREVSPGEETDDPKGESITSGRVTDRPAVDTQERSREVSVRKPSGVPAKKDNSGIVKPAAEKSILPEEREPVPEKRRVPDRKTASRKDESAVKEDDLKDKRSEIYAAVEKKDVSEKTQSADKGETLKDTKDDDSTASVKKIETAAKSEVVPDDKEKEITKVITDKTKAGDVKYNRLDRIHLYSGEVLTGAVTVRSGTYTIVTPEGIRKIDSKDIQGNDIVK